MKTEMFAALVYIEATNGDRSPEARRRTITGMVDLFVHETAVTEYHRGRADGAIEACRGLGGLDGQLDELRAALKRDDE